MGTKFVVELSAADEAVLKSLMRIFKSLGELAAADPVATFDPGKADAPAVEAAPTRRRARAEAPSPSEAPASVAGAPEPRRRRMVEAPAPAPVEAPVRRRRGADVAEQGISDADIVKAASNAAAKLTPAVVMQILKEDFGVEQASDLPADARQKFLDTLKFEMGN